MTPSRFSVDPHILDNTDLSKVEALRHWQHQLSVLLEQLQSATVYLPPTPSAAVYLDGTGNWSAPAGGGGGTGDMLKSVYDTNNNGIVDTADAIVLAHVTGAGTAASKDVPPASTYNTPSVFQVKNSGTPSGTLSSRAITFTSSVIVGSVIALIISYGDSVLPTQTVSSVTDNLGNTYTAQKAYSVGFIDSGGNQGGQAIYIATVTTGGSCTVTVTLSAAAKFFIIGGLECRNVNGLTDGSASAGQSYLASTSASSGAITTTTPNDLLLGLFTLFDGPAGSPSWTTQISSYTLGVNSTVGSSPGSYTALMTSSGNSGWAASVLALKASSTTVNATATQVVMGNDTRLTDSRTPTAHAPTHITGGSDIIPVATTSAVGLSPILSGTAGTFLNGTGAWTTPSVGAPPSSLTDLGSPAGNSTINTGQAFLNAVNLVWTTAANWTLTLQNVILGAEFHLRFLNSSGATRTFTIVATNPSAASYTIAVYVPGSNALTGVLSINNGNAINLRGASYTVGGNPTIQLFGFGSTG